MKPLDLAGKRFGRLTAVSRFLGVKPTRWLCVCECGTETTVSVSNLVRAHVSSCGCLKRELESRGGGNLKHGLTDSPTWHTWVSMIQRCTNSAKDAYPYYGGRGIKVCDRWNSFENFLADMGLRPEGMTLDRYPNKDGNYEPGNCRWATQKEQSDNRRKRTGHKTHCIHGHLLPSVGVNSGPNARRCLICHSASELKRRAKRKDLAPGVSIPEVELELQKCMGLAA